MRVSVSGMSVAIHGVDFSVRVRGCYEAIGSVMFPRDGEEEIEEGGCRSVARLCLSVCLSRVYLCLL